MELRQVGKYTIVEKIGAGAMGEVFRAHDPVLGRDVAIKVVLGKLSDDEKARERFLREAKAAAGLQHPNIITVYDFNHEGGMAYMVMELLEGTDLRTLLREGKLTALEEKLSLMDQVLDGVAFAHSHGVLHRDLKPGNVHVLPNGQIKIMDFGLARRSGDPAASGVVMGTPYYMAPEQAQGDRPTARSDVFSLGAMFYELLSGRRPFTGSAIPAVLFAVVHRDPEPLGKLLPDLPTGIVAMVMRALAKQPAARQADAGEMLAALRLAFSGGEVAAEEAAFASDDRTPAKDLGRSLAELPDASPELREALDGIEQYLEDRVPPLMVADSVDALLGAPKQPAAAELFGWATRLHAARPEAPVVDLLYHALHKLSVIGELALVDNRKLLAYLRETGTILAAACPPGLDRDRFRRQLQHLGEAEMVRSGPVEPSVPADAKPAPAPVAQALTPGRRRLSILEQRLRREALLGPGAEIARRRVATQALAAAAIEAQSEQDLESHLRRLKDMGVASGAEQVFRSLGQQLGDWALPKDLAEDTADLGPAQEVRAMKQIVALPEDPIEVARRYRHLVSAATEQFNEGNIGRAVQMFALARTLAADKKIEAGFLEPIQKKGHEELDPARLRHYMDRPDRLPQLAEVMDFFAEGMSAEKLLEQLETEERREKRRLLLDLLVVHGEKARTLATTKIEADTPGASDFARRNWIYLLRLIPRKGGDPADSEIEAVGRCALPGRPGFLMKEALTYLGQTRHPRMPEALTALLATWEEELAKPEIDDAAIEEGMAALDRLAAALARQGGAKGWRALVRHALSKQPELGDTMARLVELGSQDLSGSADVVSTLVALVKDSLPKGMLGRLVSRQDPGLPSLIGSLAGTRTPEVRALLEDVAERFASQQAGKAAQHALEGPTSASGGQPALPGLGHSGELDGYSLPALLHRLAQEKASGTLSLLPREGGAAASLGFASGRLASARFAHREGAAALYQLFERPFPGEFAFDAVSDPGDGAAELGDLATLMREGLKRSRQVAVASGLVPDDAPLEATGEAPLTVLDEPEYDLVVTIWQRATSQVTLREMEAQLAADTFRILRPLAQWLEQGSLRFSAAAAPAPAQPIRSE